jgi:iron(III) transport system ATP-binding protein
VVRFFGDNNIVDGTVSGGVVESAVGRFPAAGHPDGSVVLAIRPEKLVLGSAPNAIAIPCRVEAVIFVGATTHVRLRPDQAPSLTLLVKVTSDNGPDTLVNGAPVTVSVAPADVAIVPDEVP